MLAEGLQKRHPENLTFFASWYYNMFNANQCVSTVNVKNCEHQKSVHYVINQ